MRFTDDSLTRQESRDKDDGVDRAVCVQRIIVGSAAERTHRLKVGDEIVAVNGTKILSVDNAR